MASRELDVQRVLVVGSGVMGSGIAQVAARAGYRTELFDVAPGAAQRARERIAESLGRAVEKGRCTASERDEALARLSVAADLDAAAASADLIVEAAPEDLQLKKDLFARLSRAARPEAILASNTSGIPITKIAEGCEHPERVVGTHWSNPPHLIPMIEVIPGERTNEETVDAAVALVERIGYEAVVEREVPGFVENRILYAIMREAVDLVDRGIIDADGMDRCVRWGIGYKLAVIGPMELLDMAGLDIYNAVGSYLNADLSTAGEVSSTIRRLIDEGRLGMKTGGGIYDYTPEQIDALRAQRAAKLVAVRKALEG